MKKITIITGTKESTKSKFLLDKSYEFESHEIAWLKGNDLQARQHFIFSKCHDFTKLVIVESVTDYKKLTAFVYGLFVNGCVLVHKQGKKPFEIYPEVLIQCDEKITLSHLQNMGQSFLRRVEIIEINKL